MRADRLVMLAVSDAVIKHARLHAFDASGRRVGPAWPGPEDRSRIIQAHGARSHLDLAVPLSAIWPTVEDRGVDVNVPSEIDSKVRTSLESFVCGQLASLGDGRYRAIVSRNPGRWP